MIDQTKQCTIKKKFLSYSGVDISSYNCFELTPDPIYSKYDKDDLHYIIGTQQKGLKPFTQKGLKRIRKKNNKGKNAGAVLGLLNIRRRRRQNIYSVVSAKKDDKIQKLNPKSPEQIVMKALRTQFRNKIQLNHFKQEEPGKAEIEQIKRSLQKMASLRKTPRRTYRRGRNVSIPSNQTLIWDQQMKIENTLKQLGQTCPEKKRKIQKRLQRKQYQLQRRLQLIGLTNKYRFQLQAHFGDRMRGFGSSKCPRISRKQIKQFLGLKDEGTTKKNFKNKINDKSGQKFSLVQHQGQFPSLLGK